jgi:hypothetical protein
MKLPWVPLGRVQDLWKGIRKVAMLDTKEAMVKAKIELEVKREIEGAMFEIEGIAQDIMTDHRDWRGDVMVG